MWRSGSVWLLYCAVCYSTGLRGNLEHEAHRIFPRPDPRLREDDLTTRPPVAKSLLSPSDFEQSFPPLSLAATYEDYESATISDSSLYHLEDREYYMIATEPSTDLAKRQTTNYMAANGSVSNDCTSAPVYRINNGGLSIISNGVTYTYSTRIDIVTGAGFQQFVSSATQQGDIRTTFSIDTVGNIAWLNSAFYGGQAQFCTMSNGNIYAVFSQQATPSGCTIVQLTLFSASSCVSLQAQINNIAAVLSSMQLNPATATIIQRIVTTAPAPPAVTQTPLAVTQTATRTNTATATRVVTTSVLAMLPAPSSCSNQGMQYAVFVNNQPGHVNNVYSAYDPTYIKARDAPNSNSTWTTIYYTSVVAGIGGYSSSCPNGAANLTLYSGAPTSVPCTQFSADYRGYFYVYQTGTWSFIVSGVDDYFGLWLGPLAQAGWTKANANISLAFSYNTGAPGQTLTVPLTAGQYLPMRIVHGQAVGGFAYALTIQDPNGLIAQNSQSTGSGYVVRNSCDGTTAPAFAGAFGYEY